MAKILLLGGTAEAAELAARLIGDDRCEAVTSLAGLTRMPKPVAGGVRRGGFGGPEGLANTLRADGYDLLIDATHPFAGQISRHAAEAAEATGTPRLMLVRPPFPRHPDDDFREVPDMAAAADALPEHARAFLACGRNEIAAFAHRKDLWCLMRMIEPVTGSEDLPPGEVIVGRPSEEIADERKLLEGYGIEWLVSKDSGGKAYGKIEAARELGLPVILVARPQRPNGETVADVDEAVAWVNERLF